MTTVTTMNNHVRKLRPSPNVLFRVSEAYTLIAASEMSVKQGQLKLVSALVQPK